MEWLPVLSLFSGAGGLDLGFERAGFQPLLALDISPAAVETYNWNRPLRANPARTCDLAVTDSDQIVAWWQERAGQDVWPLGIIGGPPCQAFSVSNVHKFAGDPRAKLPFAYAHILHEFNRRFGLHFFVFENVAGLGRLEHASSLRAFKRRFRQAGFSLRSFYLDAVHFRVPQFRNRMFIVGFNKALYNASKLTLPSGDQTVVSVEQAIRDLKEPLHFSRGCTTANRALHPNHWCMNPRSDKFRSGALTPGGAQGRSFRTLRWDSPSWTVAYGNREVHVHPSGQRRLSVYEAMILQGFPSHYELRGTLSDQIQLVSDAVPPPVAHAVASTVRGMLSYPPNPTSVNEQPVARGQVAQSGVRGLHTSSPRSISP